MPETSASMPKLLHLLCWSLFFSFSPLLAQRNCGTEKIDSLRRVKNPTLETKDAFEQWMGNQLLKRSSGANRIQSTYTIPVVVHIIHNGQAIGSGSNITDAQVLSQINVLNKDFQRMNTDASNTPLEFQDEASALSVEFVLAKQDPQGNATTGIVRVNGGQSSWELFEDSELKAKSYWPAEQYFNIWVTNIPEYLGYSTFPVSNLPGVENSSQDRLRDGILIHYRAFGSIDDGAFDLETQFNKGRTLTHEAGHFFGLRHIWGDVTSCFSNGDYVNDTPPQLGNTNGCPTHPQVQCSGNKMFQNYMDYTDDACMNLFTAGQFGRVETVLLNSPRRASLLTSPGSQLPGNFTLDLGIMSVTEPTTLECSGSHTPTLTIRNFGTTTITQASIQMQINGNIIQTITPTLTLSSLQQTQVSFNNYSSTPGESRDFVFTILSVNGVTDQYSGNNSTIIYNQTAVTGSSLPYTETFEGSLNNWDILNPDELTTWELRTLPGSGGTTLSINYYDYEDEGAVDKIFSPVLDATTASGLLLKFKYAYSHVSSYDGDALAVYVTTDCSDDLTNATRVFFKEGNNLATTGTRSGFVPLTSEWVTQYISLSEFIGAPQFRLAFIGRNGYGNNLYIDSVQVIGDAITDLAIDQILEPARAVCESTIAPKLNIRNQGSVTVNGFSIQVTRNNITLLIQNVADILDPGAEVTVSLSSVGLLTGTNDLVFTTTPNSLSDDVPGNNTATWSVAQITNSMSIPARENFSTPHWNFISGTNSWTLGSTNYEQSAVFEGFTTETPGTAWLVSPRLDFSKALEASLFADISYAKNLAQDEYVRMVVSDNCGLTFDHVLVEQNASAFIPITRSTNWIPASEDDWVRKYFNLNEFTGQSDILVAIQITNDNGNNFYVDNIEFFENDDPTPPEIGSRFKVYSNEALTQTFLTFNLDEQQPAEVVVSNMMGGSIAHVTVDHALNQTLTFQLNTAPAIYIFHVRIGNTWKAVKHYIGN
jgi:hypothetical protein